MPVLRLVGRSNKETVQTLEWMLQEARKGRLPDLACWFRDDGGREHAALTGLYKVDSSKALMAIMRMSTMLTRAHDGVYGPP